MIKINGNTNLILGGTNIGVYTFKSKQCILVDTGINNTSARKVDNILKSSGLKPRYIINTHHHSDHTGGNKFFYENYPGIEIYVSPICKVYVENEFLEPSILYGGNPLNELCNKGGCSKIHGTLEEGFIKINDEKFEILNLSGHAESQVGIITPDRVCFTGDSVFSEEVLDKYSFPFLYNVEDTINSLKKLSEVDCDYFLISHSKDVLNKDEFTCLIEKNIKNIKFYENQILELLVQPLTKEDLMQNIVILNELSLNIKQYFLDLSSLSGFLTYLKDKNLINYSLEDGKVYYYVI